MKIPAYFTRMLSVLILIFLLALSANAQEPLTAHLSYRLSFHQSFDGSLTTGTNFGTVSFNQDIQTSPVFSKGFLDYKTDQLVRIGCGSKQNLSYRDISSGDSLRSVAFWMNISESADTCESRQKYQNFSYLFCDNDSLKLQTQEEGSRLTLTLFDLRDTSGKSNMRLASLTPGKWYLFYISYNPLDKANYSIQLLQKNDFKGLTPIKIDHMDDLNTILKKFLPGSSGHRFSIRFKSSYYSTVDINDFRVYDRTLSATDFKRLVSYSIDNYREIVRYELGYTYKKIADEYFIGGDTEKASKYYDKCAELVDPQNKNAIDTVALEEISPLYVTSYKLLVKDVGYRQTLLAQNYSFWGQDFSTTPLYPVTEYNAMEKTWNNFDKMYKEIQQLLANQYNEDEKQLKERIKNLSAAYELDIAKVQDEQKKYNIDFYDDQASAITDQLTNIDIEQRSIDNDVARKNDELSKNEAQLTSIVSRSIAQSVTGVPIDPKTGLKDNLINLGTTVINNNPQLAQSLLGTQNDLLSIAKVSVDYYKTAQSGLAAVKAVANGNITPGNLLTIGNTLAHAGAIDAENWNVIKNKINDAEKYPEQLKALQKQAKSLITQAQFIANKDININNLSGFLKWGADANYFPEYKNYAGLYTAGCENVRRKDYAALLQLGDKILDATNLGQIPQIDAIKQNLSSLRGQYYALKPIESILERIELDKDGEITSALGKVITGKDIKDVVLDYKIQEFLLKGINNCLISSKNDAFNQRLLTALVKQVPEVFITFLTPPAKKLLEDWNKIQDDNALIVAFKNSTIVVDLPTHTLTVTWNNRELMAVNADELTIASKKFSFYYNPLEKETYHHLHFLNSLLSDNSLRDTVMKHIQVSEWYQFFDPKSVSDAENAYDQVLATLSQRKRIDIINTVKQEGFKAFTGGKLLAAYTQNSGANIAKQLPAMQDVELSTLRTGGQGSSDETRHMAAAAIDMAFPGYGKAFGTATDIIANVLDSYDIIDQLKAQYEKKRKLHDQYLIKLDLLRSTMHDKQLAIL
jgi:hypothetical protein